MFPLPSVVIALMARPRKVPPQEEQLRGFKYFALLRPLLERLHQHGCDRDRAGNRRLHYDQYVALLLFYFFNPILTSLRGLQQASALDKVQRQLGCGRAALGSLSEANVVFDPALLRPLFGELAAQARPVVTGKEAEALAALTAADGSFWRGLPRMAWALWTDAEHRGAKLHLLFDVLTAVPVDATVTPAACSEPDQLRVMLQAGRLYVIDRGYAGYELFADILRAQSSFVGRLKEDAAYTVQEERSLSAAARAAGVVRGVVVSKLGTDHHKEVIGQAVRLVWVATGKVRPDGTEEILLLCTDRLELAAELVALAYKYRWQIEDFHLTLKSGCQVEDLQLETADRLIKALLLYSAVALRVVALRDLARQRPNDPCTVLLTAPQWQALYAYIHRRRPDATTPVPSLRQVVRWIGRLGGHLNRKGDGMPGVPTLWRGWRDLAVLVAGYLAGRADR